MRPLGWMLFFTLTALAAGPGCQSAKPMANPAPIASGDYERVFDAAAAVLKDRGFTLDRRSHRFGLIVTEPRPARTLFEPVGNNNATLRRSGQATLRQLRRTVRVQLEPANTPPTTRPSLAAPQVATTRPAADAEGTDGAGGYALAVRVTLQAEQRPTRRLIGATGRRVFSTLDEVPKRWQERSIRARYWQTIDRDTALEQRLLRSIVRRAERETPSTRPAPQPVPSPAGSGSG